MQMWYKEEGVARSARRVRTEVEMAMRVHDADGSGSLDFVEFATSD